MSLGTLDSGLFGEKGDDGLGRGLAEPKGGPVGGSVPADVLELSEDFELGGQLHDGTLPM